MARDALTVAGATVVTASSGAEALAALDRGAFDAAILLDIGMPDVDGYQLLQRVFAGAAEGPARSLPAAALTAYAR